MPMSRTTEVVKDLIKYKVPPKYWNTPIPEELLKGTLNEGLDVNARIKCPDPWILVPADGEDWERVNRFFYSVVKRFIKLGYTSLVISTEEFIRNIQANTFYDDEADMYTVGCRREYVALTGFGHESTNSFMKSVSEERLNALLRYRMDYLKPTMLAMGFTMDELFTTYPRTLARTLRRYTPMAV